MTGLQLSEGARSPATAIDDGLQPPSSPSSMQPVREIQNHSESTVTAQLSPSRKAVFDRFSKISMGPPSMMTDQASGKLSAPPRLVDSSKGASPFKRALMNSRRGNLSPSESNSHPAKTSLPDTSNTHAGNADISISLLNISQRLGNTSSVEFDIMASPDDSLLVEARKMGDESFDHRLMQNLSPGKARLPRQQSKGRVSPAKMMLPNPVPGSPSKTSSATATENKSARSFSTLSDTSNLFDEEGEQSLLYASVKFKASPGKKMSPSKQRLLAALAENSEDAEQGGKAKTAGHSKPTSTSPLRTCDGGSPRICTSLQGKSTFVRPTPSTPAPYLAPRQPAGSVNRPATALSRTAQPPTASQSTNSRTTTAPATQATSSSRAILSPDPSTPAATPRSRPPLNASAARMRRLSALPQMTPAQGSQRSKLVTPQQTAAPTTTRMPVQTAESPSMARTPAVRPSRIAPRSSLAQKLGTTPASPRAGLATGRSGTAHGSSVASSHRRTQSQGVAATSGQLQRRTVAATSSAADHPSTRSRPAAGSTAQAISRRTTRPFLLGSGTNHSIHGKSPVLHDHAALPDVNEPAMKSPARAVGLPKSSSMSAIKCEDTPRTTVRAGRTSMIPTGLPSALRRQALAAAPPGATTSSSPRRARPMANDGSHR